MTRDKIQHCLVQLKWLRICIEKKSTYKEKVRDIKQAKEEIFNALDSEGLIYEHEVLYPYGNYSEMEGCLRAMEKMVVAKVHNTAKKEALEKNFNSLIRHIDYYLKIRPEIKEGDSFEIYL